MNTDKRIKIINSDCLDIFKKMPNESVDLIVTDPPYRCISGGKPHSKGQPSGILLKMMEKFLLKII